MGTDGTASSSRPNSLIKSNSRSKLLRRKSNRQEDTDLKEATLRGGYSSGWTSLTSTSLLASGVLKGATHHVPQDRMMIIDNFGCPGQMFLGVFDGHGPDGHIVADFLKDTMPQL